MRQTHLLKLDPPYKIIWDEKNRRLFKHIATLIDVELNDKPENSLKHTVEYPIDETGKVMETTLDSCAPQCSEYESITLKDFTWLLISVPQSEWTPNGFFSIMRLASMFRYYNIDVEFPGEQEAGEEPIVFEEYLMLGCGEDNKWWVENHIENFFFGTCVKSKEELRAYIEYMRNEYYRAFSDKNFRIVFTTNNKDFKEFVDEINSTSR